MEWKITIPNKPKQRIVVLFNAIENKLEIYGKISINGHQVDLVHKAISLMPVRTIEIIDGNSRDYYTEFDKTSILEIIGNVYEELQKKVENLNGLNELFKEIKEIGMSNDFIETVL